MATTTQQDDTRPILPATQATARAAITSVLRALLTMTALTWLYFLVPLDGRISTSGGALLAVGLVVFAVLVTLEFTSITRSRSPVLRAFEALGVVAPFLLLLFASTYYLMAHDDAGAFSQPLTRVDSLYFSVTVFATVGFGDIVAVSQNARIAVTVQMMADLIVIGVGVRLLVGAVRRGLARRDEARTPPRSPPASG